MVAFMDVQPVTAGHVLVTPRRHVARLADLDEALGAHLWRVAHRIARALRRSGLPAEGVNLFLADGEAASQEIMHVHLHVFPRFRGDGFRLEAQWRMRERRELDQAASAVQASLAALAVVAPPASRSSSAG